MKEKMTDTEKLKAALEHLLKLPEFSYATLPSTGETVKIVRGEDGYFPANTVHPAGMMNMLEGITDLQAEAMFNCSMYGWHIPGANPDFLKSMHENIKKK